MTGINLTCPKVQSLNDNGNSGRLSITSKSNLSDEKDDSGVSSVDNISLNSSVEQVRKYLFKNFFKLIYRFLNRTKSIHHLPHQNL